VNALYVDNPAALTSLCEQLQGSEWLALDTEFIREKTYYPQLCLLQVATEQVIACVDPLVLEDLTPLLALLYDPAVTKVLHAAGQDLEIFFHLYNAVPAPVFDTQLAAALLGEGEQIGYAALVKSLLGVELDKSQTRTDWSWRPLSPEQLAYAADDVRYLCEVYRLQQAELTQRKRLDWLADDFRALCDPAQYRLDSQNAWRRIKAHQQLRGVQLAVLQALAAWREERASTDNRPRRWIVSDDALLEMARQLPRDAGRLKRLRGLDDNFLERHGQTLLQLIQTARALPPERWPQPVPRKRLSPEQEALVDAMMALVRLRGAARAVSPQSLTSRKELEQWLLTQSDIPLMHGWRATLAGHDVQALLRGELRLEVRDGVLCAVACS